MYLWVVLYGIWRRYNKCIHVYMTRFDHKKDMNYIYMTEIYQYLYKVDQLFKTGLTSLAHFIYNSINNLYPLVVEPIHIEMDQQ